MMTHVPTQRPPRRPARRPGFTLLELMVSVAIVLVLILGVNQVFSLTGRTIGSGQAYSDISRDARAATNVFAQDAESSAVSDGPFFLIHSFTTPAYRTKAEQVAGDATLSYRTDSAILFARGNFHRQTGDTGFISSAVSAEAYIRYGHLRLPGTTTATNNYKAPGELTAVQNPNNFFATQWVLGRSVVLLREKDAAGTILDRPGGTAQQFYSDSGTYAPFAQGSTAGSSQFQWSRYDLAATSLDGYYRKLKTLLTTTPGAVWWSAVGDFRFEGNPQPPRPLMPDTAALLAPVFLSNCTTFMVEYAGDFVTQENSPGASSDAPKMVKDPLTEKQSYFVSDGQIDYAIDPVSKLKKVRWYGFYRDTTNGSTAVNDVVPMMKFTGVQAPFERGTVPPSATSTNHYWAAWGPDTDALGIARPKMLRFTIVLDDPGNRIASGQAFEFVVNVH